ncbi:MAG: TPM domain-containing protein [Bacteroidia bacterium]
MAAPDIFTQAQQDAIKASIDEAELMTSGELRLFIDDHCKDADPIKKAVKIFAELKMDKTDLRNGVLVYLSVKDHKFAIIGDKGIHEKVKDDFWNETKELMLSHFKNNQLVEGLTAGIKKAGAALAVHFPRQSNDSNELSNDIVFGNK